MFSNIAINIVDMLDIDCQKIISVHRMLLAAPRNIEKN
jgi:hypothetical protein